MLLPFSFDIPLNTTAPGEEVGAYFALGRGYLSNDAFGSAIELRGTALAGAYTVLAMQLGVLTTIVTPGGGVGTITLALVKADNASGANVATVVDSGAMPDGFANFNGFLVPSGGSYALTAGALLALRITSNAAATTYGITGGGSVLLRRDA